MSAYNIRIETRSPSGVGRERTHSYGWADREEAQIEADFGNKYLSTEMIEGVKNTLHWYVEKNEA
jgi:hypothetical protein